MDVPQRRSVAATLSESNRTALQRWPAAEQQHSLTDRPCTTFDRSSRAAISSGGPVDQGHHGDRLHERGLGVRRRTGSRAGGMDRTVSLMMTSRSRGNRRRCEVGFLPVGMESVAPLLRLGATLLAPHTDAAPVEGDDHRLRPFFVLGPRFLRLTRTRPPSRETTTRFPVTRSSRPHAALCWAARARAA